MASSLDELVKNLSKDQLVGTRRQFAKDEDFNLVSKKGVYPYEYVDRLERLKDGRLPSKEEFYSKLTDTSVSDEDYAHAQKVWRHFEMNTMRDYHDLYLKTDVMLLEDVFESFRKVCKNHYGLDPAFYYTSPGLSWNALLKTTKIELDLLTDIDMLLMVEKGIRGGVSTITKRHAKANNKYMDYIRNAEHTGDSMYDKSKPSVFLPYLDANNLYGCAMSMSLPVGDFKWMDKLTHWRDTPCILEVDLEYPEELQDYHNEYPLAPERLMVNGVEKLIPNLNNKTNYVIHCENLKMCLDYGLKLTKIRRGITFREEAWMEQYIDLNTQLRTKAKNSFEKDFFKLMNNSVFGKTMENTSGETKLPSSYNI